MNTTRLASLGFFKWVLRLFSFGIRRDCLSPGEWLFPSVDIESLAMQDIFKYLNGLDSTFLKDAVIVMQRIVLQEAQLGSMDRIHQIADAIIDTFSFNSFADDKRLSASSFWRIVLLRVLVEIYVDLTLSIDITSKAAILKAFVDAISIKFVVIVLSKIEESATFCMLLRLYGALVELHPSLIRDIASYDPFRLLSLRVGTSFAAVTVALSVFFRVPHEDIPYLNEITNYTELSSSLIQDKLDKGGPAYDDILQTSDLLLPNTIAIDYVLPLLDLILDGVHGGCDGLEDKEASRSIFILSTLRKGMNRFTALKKCLISKTAVNKLTLILASYDDYEGGLDKAVIPLRDGVYGETKRLLKLISIESIRLKEPMVVSYIALRAPGTSIECINIIVKKALESSDLFVSAQAVGAMLIYLIPVIRSRIYDENACLLIFEHVVVLMRALIDTSSLDESKVESLIYEYIYLLRYMCVVCLYNGTRNSHTSSNENLSMRRAVHICYTAIDALLMQPLQDEATNLMIESSEVDAGNVGQKVIDILSKSLNQKSNLENAYNCQAFLEVKAFTRIFTALLVQIGFSLVNSVDLIVKRDMCRIIVYITIKKGAQLKALLSPMGTNEEATPENSVNIFHEILIPLLPPKDSLPEFVKGYKEYDVVIDGETDRMDEFFVNAATIYSSGHEVIETLGDIFSRLFPEDVTGITKRLSVLTRSEMKPRNLNARNLSDITIYFSDRRSRFEYLCNKWLCSGFMSLSSGALEWKRIWSTLLCGVIWGDISNCVLEDEQRDISGDFPDVLRWRLDIREGPERSRFRLEQSVSQFEPSKAVAKTREENSPERHLNVEDLYNKLIRDGVIRRDSSADEIEENEVNFSNTELQMDSIEDVRLSTPSRVGKNIESKEVLYMDFSSPPSTPSLAISIRDAIETRSQMLVDIVKGIVGPTEWYDSRTANVERLCGLESYPALLIITPANIHILR